MKDIEVLLMWLAKDISCEDARISLQITLSE